MYVTYVSNVSPLSTYGAVYKVLIDKLYKNSWWEFHTLVEKGKEIVEIEDFDICIFIIFEV